ncbi:MAG: glycosyltransferase family 2 protein [Bacteroidota bacterium]|nr:glycosyltransferase family 2 protein [Bacteroidota bacterium]
MRNIFVIIPAFNEQEAIGKVIKDIPDIVTEIVVTDNGSTDNTILTAKNAGATVLIENEKGYGAACLKALNYIYSKNPDDEDIIVFLDGDYSDHPEELIDLADPIENQNFDLILGSRILGMKAGKVESGALLPQAIFGNKLSAFFIKLFWKYEFTDLGPFRAVKVSSLRKMNMRDRNFGWTVEMQIKAAILKMKCLEIPVSYRKRIGQSKVSGTISGSFKAGVIILYTIFYYVFKRI